MNQPGEFLHERREKFRSLDEGKTAGRGRARRYLPTEHHDRKPWLNGKVNDMFSQSAYRKPNSARSGTATGPWTTPNRS